MYKRKITTVLCAPLTLIDFIKHYDEEDINKTPYERFQERFDIRTYSKTQDLSIIISTAVVAGAASAAVGSIIGMKMALEKYATKSQNYKTIEEFNVVRETYTFSKMSAGVFRWGVAGFSLTLISSALIVLTGIYRGQPGVTEFAVSGAIYGVCYGIYANIPNGAIYGGILGALIGIGSGFLLILSFAKNRPFKNLRPWENDVKNDTDKR